MRYEYRGWLTSLFFPLAARKPRRPQYDQNWRGSPHVAPCAFIIIMADVVAHDADYLSQHTFSAAFLQKSLNYSVGDLDYGPKLCRDYLLITGWGRSTKENHWNNVARLMRTLISLPSKLNYEVQAECFKYIQCTNEPASNVQPSDRELLYTLSEKTPVNDFQWGVWCWSKSAPVDFQCACVEYVLDLMGKGLDALKMGLPSASVDSDSETTSSIPSSSVRMRSSQQSDNG